MSDSFDSWAILELMGHVRMAGRVTEEERFGSKMGRIDVPRDVACPNCDGTGNGAVDPNDPEDCLPCVLCDGKGTVDSFTTVYFGGGSVYRMTPTTEEIARAVAVQSQLAPIHRWELPKPKEATAVFHGMDEPERYDDGRDDEPDDDLPL